MLAPPTPRAFVHDERGFTLTETLVAILAGVILVGALYTILEVSLHQTTRLSERVQADQLGRGTMTRVVDELHSVCLSPGFTPIQEGSNANELIFINAYSKEALIPPATEASPANTGAYKHKIVWSEKTGTLTDFAYPSNGGTWPTFTFAAAASPVAGTVIGENISEEKAKAVPIFQYYKYATESTSNEQTGVSTFTPLVPPEKEGFTATAAKEAASVLVSFNAAPVAKTQAGRSVNFSTQVAFAFSAPSAEKSIQAAPCE